MKNKPPRGDVPLTKEPLSAVHVVSAEVVLVTCDGHNFDFISAHIGYIYNRRPWKKLTVNPVSLDTSKDGKRDVDPEEIRPGWLSKDVLIISLGCFIFRNRVASSFC